MLPGEKWEWLFNLRDRVLTSNLPCKIKIFPEEMQVQGVTYDDIVQIGRDYGLKMTIQPTTDPSRDDLFVSVENEEKYKRALSILTMEGWPVRLGDFSTEAKRSNIEIQKAAMLKAMQRAYPPPIPGKEFWGTGLAGSILGTMNGQMAGMSQAMSEQMASWQEPFASSYPFEPKALDPHRAFINTEKEIWMTNAELSPKPKISKIPHLICTQCWGIFEVTRKLKRCWWCQKKFGWWRLRKAKQKLKRLQVVEPFLNTLS